MSNLFTTVSVEQQAIVSGGVTFSAAGAETASFREFQQLFGTESRVGRDGVNTRTLLTNVSIESLSNRTIAITPVNF
ncbi:MAG: hypothetical protein HEQ10_00550 [Dolichospermum sp. DEX182a]|nr:hypothetical protein [Dolichospermum sp. DEX182a]